MTEEQEDLEALVKAPGWLRVQAFAAAEWSTQMEQHLSAAANDTNDLLALQKIRQVIAARRAVERVLGWPKERLQTLRGQAQHAVIAQGHTRGGL